MFGLSPMELMIVGVIAVLLFGSRLPGVARSLGKSMMEFKKGMQDLQDEVRGAGSAPPKVRRYHEIDDRDEPTAPKFEPPSAEPTAENPDEAHRDEAGPDEGKTDEGKTDEANPDAPQDSAAVSV